VKVRWTSEAEQDRSGVWDFIADDNQLAAVRMDELFSDAAMSLADFPQLGRAGKIAGTRELIPHESYRLVYEVEEETVWILALVSTARQWPPIIR
jgi:addiction module RelE/StbE family toxin